MREFHLRQQLETEVAQLREANRRLEAEVAQQEKEKKRMQLQMRGLESKLHQLQQKQKPAPAPARAAVSSPTSGCKRKADSRPDTPVRQCRHSKQRA